MVWLRFYDCHLVCGLNLAFGTRYSLLIVDGVVSQYKLT